MTKFPVLFLLVWLTVSSCASYAQEQYVHRNEQVWVSDISPQTAHSHDPSDVLLAGLETIFHDPELCCGKDSALIDNVLAVDPLSLKELGSKLQGRHVLGDGRRIIVTAEYIPASATIGDTVGTRVLACLMKDQPLLMKWNARLYVVQGAAFDEAVNESYVHDYAIRSLMLFDPSGTHPNTSFDRLRDKWNAVEGFLVLKVEPAA